jgi:DNA-binding LytR/AlgR family response regulator
MMTQSTPLRILVVEDEPLFAEQLEMALEKLGYQPIGPAATAAEALALCQPSSWPDLALLDINIDGPTDGIALAAQLQASQPLPIIFLTARADDATFAQARPLGPAAYLIKPVTADALQRSIELAVANFVASHAPAAEEPDHQPVFPSNNTGMLVPDVLFVKQDGLLVKVRLTEIQWIQAEAKQCRLQLQGREVLVRQPLRELALLLPSQQFVQIQRSYLVNVNHIDRLDPVRNLVQVGAHVLPLSLTYRDELLRRLQLV